MAGGSNSKSKNKSSGGTANRKSDPDKKDKVGKKKWTKPTAPTSPVTKPIMSPEKEKAMNKKSSNRRSSESTMTNVSTEDVPRISNRRSTEKKEEENGTSTMRTSKATSDMSVSMSVSTESTVSRSNEKRGRGEEDEKEKKSKKKLSKDLTLLKQKRIQTARKLDEKVNRCRSKGRPLMVGQVDARQEIERAEANLKEWTKQFGQQMNELREYLTKEMGEVRNGMRELEEAEIRTEMEAKHVRGAKLPEESLLRTIRLAVRKEEKDMRREEEDGDGEWMMRCTTADDEETKEMAIQCASGGGISSSDVLIEFLQDESSDIREKAAIVLGELEYGSGTRLNPFVLRIGQEKERGKEIVKKEGKEETGVNLFDAMVDNPYKESRLIGECPYTRGILQRLKL